MNLDEQLEVLEESGQTEAEQIDEQSEIQDVQDDMDEIIGEDALQSDQQKAYESFITENEEDYNGFDPDAVEKREAAEEVANLTSQGEHIEDGHELEEEVIEMEIEDGDIYAYIYDQDDNEIGFVLIDEDGAEQEYYYVDPDEYEIVDEDGDEGAKVVRAEDGEEFDLGITREGVAQATTDVNAIYKDGKEVFTELKETVDDITESLSFLKKKRR